MPRTDYRSLFLEETLQPAWGGLAVYDQAMPGRTLQLNDQSQVEMVFNCRRLSCPMVERAITLDEGVVRLVHALGALHLLHAPDYTVGETLDYLQQQGVERDVASTTNDNHPLCIIAAPALAEQLEASGTGRVGFRFYALPGMVPNLVLGLPWKYLFGRIPQLGTAWGAQIFNTAASVACFAGEKDATHGYFLEPKGPDAWQRITLDVSEAQLYQR